MPNVYAGKILKIDLTTRRTTSRLVTDSEVQAFLMGSGLAAKIYYEEYADLLDPQIDPLDPRNPLIILNGLLRLPLLVVWPLAPHRHLERGQPRRALGRGTALRGLGWPHPHREMRPAHLSLD
ncbi:MAG: aor2 [Anaerolineales bacterium]|nr:aor2 [Anaerolineales bacterium]